MPKAHLLFSEMTWPRSIVFLLRAAQKHADVVAGARFVESLRNISMSVAVVFARGP